MTGAEILRALSKAIEHKTPTNPADDHYISRKDLLKALEEAAQDVSDSEWYERMGEDV